MDRPSGNFLLIGGKCVRKWQWKFLNKTRESPLKEILKKHIGSATAFGALKIFNKNDELSIRSIFIKRIQVVGARLE